MVITGYRKAVYPHVRPRPRSCPHPQSIQYGSSYVYPLARSRSSAISLVIESEHERTDADAKVDTLLYAFKEAAATALTNIPVPKLWHCFSRK